ncbi:MAG: preprotein translocase subunit SecA [Peptostreptococcaceae bacterium]
MSKLQKIFNPDKKELKELEKIVDKIEAMEEIVSSLSDDELKSKTNEFREQLQNGKTLDDILVEVFAVCREASKRVLNMRQYRVQLMGGIVLHKSKIAQMRTGEGKTLVAVAPVYLNALIGKGVHVVTVNDYLAKRDKELMEPVYDFLGLSVGVILHGQEPDIRRKEYGCDITYATNNELGFDYLKDNMVLRKEDMVQRGLNYAIVDEIDSILIDEARTPLIISGQISLDEADFRIANVFIKILLPSDYEYKDKEKAIHLTDSGIEKAQFFYKIDNLMDVENMNTYHHINQALKADVVLRRDVDYVVKKGKVELIDVFTGRVMDGRRFSEGLHQAIEAKENLEIQNESKTLATITYQNFFRMYDKLSGMTGTAKTEEEEFEAIYRMNVVEIPTNNPVIREDLKEKLFVNEVEKFKAIALEVEKVHKEIKQPMLIGTASIEKSEILSYLLKLRGVPHNVLNAKKHEEEANIVKEAGKLGAVTVATNMAGRGTDIKLGEGVREIGGLYVIGSEKSENRRVDNQLKGRSGRQGDIGKSIFYSSLDDSLIKNYGSNKIDKITSKQENEKEFFHKDLDKLIESAQIGLESTNFQIRKEVLKYDDVMNSQRRVIYSDRQKALMSEDGSEVIKEMISYIIKYSFDNYINVDEGSDEIKYISIEYDKFINSLFKIKNFTVEGKEIHEIIDYTEGLVFEKYESVTLENENIKKMQIQLALGMIDKHWVEHLDIMQQLQKAVPLQAIGQKDPVKEFTFEAYEIFNVMNFNIIYDTLNHVFK